MSFLSLPLWAVIAGAVCLAALLFGLQVLKARQKHVRIAAAGLWAQAARVTPLRVFRQRFQRWLAYLLILAIGLLLADLMQRQGDLPAAAQLDQQLSEQFPRDARPWLALALVRQQQGDGQASQRALVQARSRLGGQGAQRLDQVAVSWGLANLREPSGAPARSSGAGAAAN